MKQMNFVVSSTLIRYHENGSVKTITKGEPKFKELLTSILAGEDDIKLKEILHAKVAKVEGVPKEVQEVIEPRAEKLQAYDESLDSIKAFVKKLKKNPSEDSRQDLLMFLAKWDLPIVEDGDFLAYKNVSDGFRDLYSGTFDNSIGKTVSMPRSKVCTDRNRACGEGLHVCAYDYIQSSLDEGIVVVCKVNPADVVSVPHIDSSISKMRVCKYKVIDVLKQGERLSSLVAKINDGAKKTPDKKTKKEPSLLKQAERKKKSPLDRKSVV